MPSEQICLIGFGAIGCYVTRTLEEDTGAARVRYILCRPGRDSAARNALGSDSDIVHTIAELPDSVTLLLECGGHDALAEHGPVALERGMDVIAVSNGALARDGMTERLQEAAIKGKSRLRLVSGAVGALDALSAAHVGTLSSLVYRGLKPPSGWKGSLAEQTIPNLHLLTEPAVHFTGTAREAALAYPKNANVAATIALAGPGLDETTVELVADPSLTENVHDIVAIGSFGTFQFTIRGQSLPSNPKSSALTAMSVVAAVRQRGTNIRIG